MLAPPVAFEARGWEAFPPLRMEAAEFLADARVEAEGLARGQHTMTGAALIYSMMALISITAMIISTTLCHRTWARKIGAHKPIARSHL